MPLGTSVSTPRAAGTANQRAQLSAIAPDRLRRPDLGASGGRGLWIVARLVDHMRVDSGNAGTVALVEIRL